MKKLILFFVAVLFAVNVSAERGSWVVSGRIGFISMGSSWNQYNSDTSSEGYSSSFLIAPNLQYFLTDRFLLGAGVSFQTSTSSHSERSNTLGIGALVRYYFLKNQRFGIFGQANANVSFGSNSMADGSSFEAGIAPGVQYFINSRWSLEAQTRLLALGFSSSRSEMHDTNDTQRLSYFSVGVNQPSPFSFSVNFHF